MRPGRSGSNEFGIPEIERGRERLMGYNPTDVNRTGEDCEFGGITIRDKREQPVTRRYHRARRSEDDDSAIEREPKFAIDTGRDRQNSAAS